MNTNTHTVVQLTRIGYGELKQELAQLKNNKRPAVVERLSHARSMGDLSENSDYHQAKEELDFVDGKIEELENLIKNAHIIKNHKRSKVDIGCHVRVAMNGSEHLFDIVGEWEADPKEKKISHESPLGKALVGKKVGDKVEVEAPAGKVEYTILEVS